MFQKLREEGEAHPIEAVGKNLRAMMSWVRDAKKDSSDA
jgi:ketol-acid reductoisomerase